MNYKKFLSPRYCFDKAAARVWRAFGTELQSSGSKPVLENPADLRDISVEWPDRYGWGPGFNWVGSIRSGLAHYVDVRQADIPQLPNTAVCVRITHRGAVHPVIIDYNDRHDAIFDEYLRDCLVYFKMQFRNEGYGDSRIVPGQYVPSGGMDMYRYLTKLRRIRDNARPVFDVYGRFGIYRAPVVTADGAGESPWRVIENEVRNIRASAIRILDGQNGFRYRGGGDLIELSRSLREAARSKICLDLPGRGPFCHRLIDYLSIGSCVVAYPHAARLDPPLVPGKHIVYCRPDFSDLADICRYYLTHEQERRAMISASREYFDTYLHKDCIGAYYLGCIASRLGLSQHG